MLLSLGKRFAWKVLPDRWWHLLRRWHLQRKFARQGHEPEMKVIRHLLPKRGTAIDIGANFGLYTHFLAQTVTAHGRVIALEPMADTYEILENNVRQAGLQSVVLYRAAASDELGFAYMELPSYRSGGSNYYEARISASEEGERVPLIRLDDLLIRESRIDFIKCDVEGHEWPAIQGALESIQRHRPALLIEVSGNPDRIDSPARQLFDHLESMDYQPFQFYRGRLWRRQSGDRAINYFFLQPTHLRRIPIEMLCRV